MKGTRNGFASPARQTRKGIPLSQAKVLDVGNCNPDHAMIRRMLIESFDIELDRVMFVAEALEKMRTNDYALVLVNRLIFDDGSPGKELITAAKADAALAGTPIMLISNFAEAQRDAVALGAVPGFGKDNVFTPATVELLAQYLPKK